MSRVILCPQSEAAIQLAKWWDSWNFESGQEEFVADLEVREDVLFRSDLWLSLGTIRLRLPKLEPPLAPIEDPTDRGNLPVESREPHIHAAVIRGGFEWTVPPAEDFETNLIETLAGEVKGRTSGDSKAKSPLNTSRLRDALGYAFLRLGIVMPLLDPHDLGELPFKRPVTLVADTNAVLQGGVDFAARCLYPMARLRIPETVHAELSNQATSYLKARRDFKGESKDSALTALRQRVTSQGGLRALLRLQLQAGIEIERLQVEAEEPRGFDLAGGDKGGGDRSAVPDRLILQTALRHRALISASHSVKIMTSDQGLARSSLIEGITPLYLPPRSWSSLYGRTYIGALFAPLPTTSSRSIWHRVSVPEILWELAAIFGAARLRLKEGGEYRCSSTRSDLVWAPFHAKQDLLWLEFSRPSANGIPIPTATISEELEPRTDPPSPFRPSASKFSIDKLLQLWSWLNHDRSGTIKQAARALAVSETTCRDYLRLMASGDFLTIESDKVTVDSEVFDPFWSALRLNDFDGIRESLLRLPSFRAFHEELCEKRVARGEDLKAIREAVVPSYQRLGELAGAVLMIPERGLVFCEKKPPMNVFINAALAAYNEALAQDFSPSGLVLSGTWLELLALTHSIHPLVVPELIQDAINTRSLHVSFEGSQPYRNRGNHEFRRILWQKNEPSIQDTQLYRGDFLAPRHASVHLKIEKAHE